MFLKRSLAILLCLIFALSGCSMLKSDQEKFDQLSQKYEQDFNAAGSREEKVKIGEEYKKSVPKGYEDKAQVRINNALFSDSAKQYKDKKIRSTGDAKLGHYSK